MQEAYFVKAHWDGEASVWYSESNIAGLVIEAETLTEFEELMCALAPEMLAENKGIGPAKVPVNFSFSGTREFAVA